MSKILVIDDEVLRREQIKETVLTNDASDEVDLASTFATGLRNVIENKYDFIFLDHDLGPDPKGKENGYEIAKEIDGTINKNSIIVVISLNPVGVGNITSVLPNAIVCPVYLVKTQWPAIKQYAGQILGGEEK